MVVTSNRTRDVHDALKRRCLYHWVEHPDFEREVAIISLRTDGVAPALARQVAAAVGQVPRHRPVQAPRRVAESIDWSMALVRLGVNGSRIPTTAEVTLGAVLKYREDQGRVLDYGLDRIIAEATSRS